MASYEAMKKQALQLGATDLLPSWRENKKIAVLYNGRWVHAGDSRYEDFTTHRDEKRRQAYLKRHSSILLADGRPAHTVMESPAFWSWHLLWKGSNAD
jgi:hypothetical protein